MPSDFPPPKLFGGLLASLGVLLAGAGMSLDNDKYFMVVGVLMLVSGLLVYSGKKLALVTYGVTLAVVWIWSLKDAGGEVNAILPRVALPTLIAFYLYSYRVKSRLG